MDLQPSLEAELLSAYRVINRYRKREIEDLKGIISQEAGDSYAREGEMKKKNLHLRKEVRQLTRQRIGDLAQIDELETKLLDVLAPKTEPKL